jgi:hypothetical protein
MLLLAIGIAIFDAHTRLARLESDGTPLSAAIGTAACRHYFMIAHVGKLLLKY